MHYSLYIEALFNTLDLYASDIFKVKIKPWAEIISMVSSCNHIDGKTFYTFKDIKYVDGKPVTVERTFTKEDYMYFLNSDFYKENNIDGYMYLFADDLRHLSFVDLQGKFRPVGLGYQIITSIPFYMFNAEEVDEDEKANIYLKTMSKVYISLISLNTFPILKLFKCVKFGKIVHKLYMGNIMRALKQLDLRTALSTPMYLFDDSEKPKPLKSELHLHLDVVKEMFKFMFDNKDKLTSEFKEFYLQTYIKHELKTNSDVEDMLHKINLYMEDKQILELVKERLK